VLPNEINCRDSLEPPVRGINFILLTPSQVDLVPKAKFDLAINIESFAEMEQKVANAYVELTYSWLRDGGSMFVANRESREMPSGGRVSNITSFWKYPFSNTDEVVLLEYCPMRDLLTNRRKRNVNRVAIKRGSKVSSGL
jgi:hypothetical protein